MNTTPQKFNDVTDVILTNGWDRIGYNVLRGLVNENLKVVFGTDKNSGMGVFSKFTQAKFYHENFQILPEVFVSDVVRNIKGYKPKVYIPTGEEVFTIAKNINEFKELDIKIPIASYDTLVKLNDKSKSVELVKRLDIPFPDSFIPLTISDILSFGNQYGYPIVIKKFHSSSSKGVYYVNKQISATELEKLLIKYNLYFGQFLVQQFVKGTGYGVSVLFNNGNLKALFTHKRLRERIVSGGPSTLRISTRSPLLEEYTKSLLKSVNYHGVAMVEFKYDEEKNKVWFMEVNPRFWGSIGLAINSGMNFPYLLYKMAVDGDVENILDYKIGMKYKWLLGDISGVVNQILSTKNPLIIKNLFNNKDGYDDFYKDDPIPFFAMIFLILKRNIKEIIIKLFK